MPWQKIGGKCVPHTIDESLQSCRTKNARPIIMAGKALV